MHGLGATPHDFEDVVPLLQTPYLRYVFPAAPVRPVTLNGGMPMPAWYDIVSLSDPPLREDEDDVHAAAVQLTELIEREISRGVKPENIVLIGFSQGGAMALHLGLRSPRPLGGVAVLSAYLLLPQLFDEQRVTSDKPLPFFFGHGKFDPVVTPELGKTALERVKGAGYPVTHKEYPMEHSLCIEEIEDLKTWLQARFV